MSDLYLKDDQYKDLLRKIVETVNKPDFRLEKEDSDVPGCKFTETNCGMCNDHFSTKETAMWPDQWPDRLDMKYSQPYQHCPFDMRKPLGRNDVNGCFYTCSFFQRGGKRDVESIRRMAAETLAWAESEDFTFISKETYEQLESESKTPEA